MKAIILTETGPKIGLGHISRCLSLAYALKEKEIDPHFVISGGIQAEFQELDDFSTDYENWVEFSDITPKLDKFEIVVVDSYNTKTEMLKQIGRSKIFPVFIDDYNRIKYPKGIIVNSTVAATALDYPNLPNVIYLLGPRYSMLKHEYWAGYSRKLNLIPEKVLITLGANDIWNLIPRIIKQIQNFNSNFKITVVITPYFNNIDEIKEISSKSDCTMAFSPSTKQMRKLMINTDFAVTSGGQTSYELACMKVPSVVIVTAVNQLLNAQYMADLEINLYAGRWDEINLWSGLIDNISLIQSRNVRKRLIKNSNKYIKSDGSREIVKAILNNIKN